MKAWWREPNLWLTLARAIENVSGKPVLRLAGARIHRDDVYNFRRFFRGEKLNALPQVPLESTTACGDRSREHVIFRTRDSRQRFPVDVILTYRGEADRAPEAEDFRVEPRQPCSGDPPTIRRHGLLDAKSGSRSISKGYSAGKTEPLKIDGSPRLIMHSTQPVTDQIHDDIDPAEATPDRIRIEPR